jgi:hypothetical protein
LINFTQSQWFVHHIYRDLRVNNRLAAQSAGDIRRSGSGFEKMQIKPDPIGV